MKRLNGFSRFMSEVRGKGSISRTPVFSRTPIHMVVILALLMLIAAIGFTPQSHAQVVPGDTLIIDFDAGTGDRGALFRVNPANGSRTMVSDFGNGAQGTLGNNPFGVALDASGNILVIDINAGTNSRGALFRVNPSNGSRTVISDFSNSAQGSSGISLSGVAAPDASGNILVIGTQDGTNRLGALFRIDPANGNRTSVSDLGNFNQGPVLRDPQGVALDASGNILVTGLINITQSSATVGILRVNPFTGSRMMLSDFRNGAQGPLGGSPRGVALDSLGNILVIDPDAGTDGALFRVNPVNGMRTLVSDFGFSIQGPVGVFPTGVAIESSGNILVLDLIAGTGNKGMLFRVDPANGNRTLVSDFGNSTQGTLGDNPIGVAAVPPQPRLGDILVIDPFAGANDGGTLSKVDQFSGTRSLVSNFGISAQGAVGRAPVATAVDASGNLLTINPFAGTNGKGALLRVNPANGNRTLLSDFGNSAQGPVGDEPYGVAVEASGNILVTDLNAGGSGRGAIFRVNPANGIRTVVSDFNNSAQGALGEEPIGVAVESSGNILVTDLDAGAASLGALFRINPSSGRRTIVSDFLNEGQGREGINPTGIAIESSGMILVIDQSAGTRGILFRINPTNGNRTVVSDFSNSTQGPLGGSPTGVAIGSSGMILVTDPNAGTGFRGALFGVNPSGGSRVLISDFGDPSKGIPGSDPQGVVVYTVKCGGLNATRIGNSFDNTINGTSGRDIIHGLGGSDTINGQGGNDVICGGAGNDTLGGGIGNDNLFGDAGADRLDGGTGTADRCDGGTQSDTSTGCESRTNIP